MTRVVGEVPLRELVVETGIAARVQTGAAVGHLFLEDASETERLRDALAEVRGLRILEGTELPDELRLRHPTRTGDLVAIAEPGWVFRGTNLQRRAWRWIRGIFGAGTGMHGYDPEHPDMGGVFLAIGRGAPAGARLESIRMVDVAPTVAALLGIEPPRHSEGQPVPRLEPTR